MDFIISLLASSSLLLLFIVIGLGFLAGSIRVAGFSLGPAAVLFVGILFGSLDPRFRIPDLVYVLGLVIFVYTIGIQSGPSFFGSFGKRSFRANVLAVVVILLGAGMTLVARSALHLPGAVLAGVFCGALTNTPALAASIDAVRHVAGPNGVPAEVANGPVIGFSVSYPFGVIGVLICFYIIGKWRSARDGAPAYRGDDAANGPVMAQTFRVVNVEAMSASVADLLSMEANRGFVLSRMRRKKDTTLVYAETSLQKDDLVVAVGTPDALQRALKLFGEISPKEIQRENEEFDFRRIEISDPNVVGKRLGELNLQEMLDTTITRIRRGDVDFVPTGDTVLERGDWVRVLTWAGNIDRLCRYFGDSVKKASETDFLSVSIGLVAGVLLGMLPIPLPGGGTFSFGFAGGPLLVGLLLGRLGRSGSIVWSMPYGANLTLRQLGLVLFLAGVGTKAGDGFLQTLSHGGWVMMSVGALMTVAVTVIVMTAGTSLLGLSFASAMGLMAGIQTQPACLAYANEHVTSNEPNVWYASVYPVSMIAKIVLVQLLVGWLLS